MCTAVCTPASRAAVLCLRGDSEYFMTCSQKLSKIAFFKFPVNTVTLTKGQGHLRSHHFKILPTGYLWAKSHNSTVNSVWDIVNDKVFHTLTDRWTDRRHTVITKTHFVYTHEPKMTIFHIVNAQICKISSHSLIQGGVNFFVWGQGCRSSKNQGYPYPLCKNLRVFIPFLFFLEGFIPSAITV